MKQRKYCLIVLVLIVSVIFVGYSCGADEPEEGKQEAKTQLMNSIIETSAFLDFKRYNNEVCRKVLDYTSTLNQKEFDKLMYNLNNDDFMEDFINKAGVKDKLFLLAQAKKKLLANTKISQLNKTEQTQLFLNFSEKNMRMVVKSRSVEAGIGEVPVSTCDQRRRDEYAWAQAKADLGAIGCTCLIEIPFVACLCYATVLANFADDIRKADIAYEDCIRQHN